ncbi:MAG: hypothetical protein LH615_03495, partial [Ferruginibacter sp.]|nr:hypothetical protein [Ferruginibacter sp.]
MNTKIILLAISLAAISSCTTLYKSGQTPDDVYYSPNRTIYGEEKREEKRDEDGVETRRYNYNNEDAAIRMGIYDSRWRYLDNDYRYNPYNYGFNHGYYYNPYYWPYPVYSPVFTTPVNPKITTPRFNNLGTYGATNGYNNVPVNPKTGRRVPVRNYNNNNNNGSAVGNALRKVLGADNNNYNNNSNNNSSNNNRTYTPSNNNSNSSSSGSSSSGSSSSGGTISRPPRSGGN